MQRHDLCAVLLRLVLIFGIAKLLVDHVELFAQIVIALTAVYAVLYLLLQLRLQPNNIQLFRKHFYNEFQPLYGVQLLQNLLLFKIVERGVLRDEIRHV